MSIQLITFDLDDTLWDNRPVIEGAETAMRDWLMEHTPALGALPVEHLWAIRGEVLAAEPPRAGPWRPWATPPKTPSTWPKAPSRPCFMHATASPSSPTPCPPWSASPCATAWA